MLQQHRTAIIKNIGRVIELDDEEIKWFSSLLEVRSFDKKDFVLQAGDICQYQNYVVSGCLKIYYTDNTGIEHTVKFAIEDWWAVDLQSFTTQTPAFYSIQALENTDVVRIGKTGYDALHERIPKFEKFSRLMFQNSYILLQNRMTQNLFEPAEEKYRHFSEKYPGLELRIPQKEIASYLGITPEFLSIIRRRRKNGIFS
ncbi:MAG: Crp/Fnr family transcriptional regulator [Bacteroidetes bacterium]|nr:Crp/Fnr family transcriptional regulator [Bacteroidota bacterium]